MELGLRLSTTGFFNRVYDQIKRLRLNLSTCSVGDWAITGTQIGGGGGVSSLLYIFIVYNMQKGEEGVQIKVRT